MITKNKSQLTYFKQIIHLLGPDQGKLPFMVLLFLGSSMLDLAGLWLIGPYVALLIDFRTIDGPIGYIVNFIGLPSGQQPLLIALGLGLFIIFLLKSISGIGVYWMITNFSLSQQLRIRSYLMQSYQTLPFTELLRRNSSEYVDSIHRRAGQYANVVMSLLRSTSDGIVGLVILVLLAWTNWPALVLLAVLNGIMIFSFDRLFRKYLKIYGLKVNQASTQLLQSINEGIEGLKEIRILGSAGYFLNKVRDAAQKMKYYQTRSLVIQITPRYILELIMVVFIVLMVFGMLQFEKDLKMLLPTLGVFGVAALRLMPIANMFSTSLATIRFSHDTVSQLHHDLKQLNHLQRESPSDSDKSQSVLKTAEFSGDTLSSLELRNLSFRYPDAPQDVLHDISLKINSGESIGLIGPSGAGKTTMLDVLLGLLEPQKGEVTFNGKPLSETLTDWQSQVAYIPQEIFLIDNTLKRNVALGFDAQEINEDRVIEALQKARLIELVAQLPLGLETLLGERGARLSGGQRQRVALARAFYHGRSILFMDEATSSLDSETEREIVAEIKLLKEKTTIIVVAHRMTSVQYCDRIYQLEKGRIVENDFAAQMLK